LDQKRLIEIAKEARRHAIANFSNFKVGAAIEASDGKVFTGCNIENATYGLTVCAERVAIWKALSEGTRDFKTLVIIADTKKLITPCGACRQLIWEFCGDITIILANIEDKFEVMHVHDLFPRAFDAQSLEY
jgi:cytidine deaminase